MPERIDIKAQEGPDYTLLENIISEPEEKSNFEEQDELYTNARDLVLSVGQASISYIQRRMKIGYNRAARIMEMLEDEGIVGPPGEEFQGKSCPFTLCSC